MLLGLGFIVAVFYERDLTIEDAQTLQITVLGMLVVFMGIILGW